MSPQSSTQIQNLSVNVDVKLGRVASLKKLTNCHSRDLTRSPWQIWFRRRPEHSPSNFPTPAFAFLPRSLNASWFLTQSQRKFKRLIPHVWDFTRTRICSKTGTVNQMTIGCPKSLIERFNRMVCLIGDQDILQYKNVVPARSSAKTDYSTDGAPDSYVYKIKCHNWNLWVSRVILPMKIL